MAGKAACLREETLGKLDNGDKRGRKKRRVKLKEKLWKHVCSNKTSRRIVLGYDKEIDVTKTRGK
jgi:hypothetical protein